MTTVQIHPLGAPASRWSCGASLIALVAAIGLSSCTIRPDDRPAPRLSPYSVASPVLWGVAPLRNESGTSAVDELYITDLLVSEIQQFPGVDALPTSRTIAAMNAIGLRSVDTPEQAQALAQALGADALLVGNITAYDPYDPPTLGVNLALFSGAGPATQDIIYEPFDPLAFRAQPVESVVIQDQAPSSAPLSVLGDVVDAADGGVRARIRQYAEGRHDPATSLGWQRYVKSMDLYAKFVCFDMTRRLLDHERRRLGLEETELTSATLP